MRRLTLRERRFGLCSVPFQVSQNKAQESMREPGFSCLSARKEGGIGDVYNYVTPLGFCSGAMHWQANDAPIIPRPFGRGKEYVAPTGYPCDAPLGLVFNSIVTNRKEMQLR